MNEFKEIINILLNPKTTFVKNKSTNIITVVYIIEDKSQA